MPDNKMFRLVSDLYEVVPGVLRQTGKVKNPWPNVDAHSGVILQHYGIMEENFYTVRPFLQPPLSLTAPAAAAPPVMGAEPVVGVYSQASSAELCPQGFHELRNEKQGAASRCARRAGAVRREPRHRRAQCAVLVTRARAADRAAEVGDHGRAGEQVQAVCRRIAGFRRPQIGFHRLQVVFGL